MRRQWRWKRRRRSCSSTISNRPRLCEKSVRNEAVGKLFNFPLRLAVKRDEEWDCASKSGGFVSIFPTGDMTPDFLHSLGQKRKSEVTPLDVCFTLKTGHRRDKCKTPLWVHVVAHAAYAQA